MAKGILGSPGIDITAVAGWLAPDSHGFVGPRRDQIADELIRRNPHHA